MGCCKLTSRSFYFPGFLVGPYLDYASYDQLVKETLFTPKGKGKERADWHDDSLQRDWKVLETWNVNLNDLQPFPGNVRILHNVKCGHL